MSEEVTTVSKDTFGYLGPAYQLKVLWQILTNVEFGNEIIPNLQSAYFDVPVQKKLLSLIKKYLDQNGKVPQIGNKSIVAHINASNYSEVEKEELHGTIKRIIIWDKNIHVGDIDDDSAAIQNYVWLFVKQQEYKKLADKIYEKIKKGTLETNVFEFEEDIKKISLMGIKDDFGTDIFDDIEAALTVNFRSPIPTGIGAIDQAMGGGLGKEEIGIILAPFGVGKTTILTKIANTAFEAEKNVLQLVFEDKVDEIRRKHFAIWSKIALSEFEVTHEFMAKTMNPQVLEKVRLHQEERDAQKLGGRLIIKKLNQDDVTIPYIKNWILNYQKNFSIKFDMVVLDYIDCVESHKPTNGDDLKAELVVIKAFEAMASELKIPCWTAVQGNRQSISSEFVRSDQMGGSIKRAQKTHFLMSIARSSDQKQDNTANMEILKARFAKDGLRFENAIFNNDTLEIRCIENGRPKAKPKNSSSLESEVDEQMKKDFMLSSLNKTSEDYFQKEAVVKKIHEEKTTGTQDTFFSHSKQIKVEDGKLIVPRIQHDETYLTFNNIDLLKQTILFATEMSNPNNNDNEDKGRDGAFKTILEGKIGELCVSDYFKNNYNKTLALDWVVRPRGQYDVHDLVDENNISYEVRTTKLIGKTCMIKTEYELDLYKKHVGYLVMVRIDTSFLENNFQYGEWLTNPTPVNYILDGSIDSEYFVSGVDSLTKFPKGVTLGSYPMRHGNIIIHADDFYEQQKNFLKTYNTFLSKNENEI